MTPPVATLAESLVRPRRTKVCLTVPMPMWASLAARKMPKPSISFTTQPAIPARNNCSAASAPFWPALWISLAATDSGNGSVGSSTITRRSTVTNMIPSRPPRIISADDTGSWRQKSPAPNCQPGSFRMTKAGIVKMAPAATDSPMEPTVLAKFSSRTLPLKTRRKAMPMTAAG